MRASRITALCAAGLVCGALPDVARSQGLVPLPVGARVQLQLADSLRPGPFAPRAQRVIGTVVREAGGVVHLRVGAQDTLRVARASVQRAAVSRGASRSRSAVQQGVIGALTVAAFSARGAGGGTSSGSAIARGAAWGAALGVVTGVLSPFESWRTISR